MPDLKKIPLSGSIHGAPVKVAATAIGTGTVIHTALATTTDGEGDEVVLDAYNSDTVSRTLTIGKGGTTSPDHLFTFVLGAKEHKTILPGVFLRNSLVIRAAADAANVVLVDGYVVRAQ